MGDEGYDLAECGSVESNSIWASAEAPVDFDEADDSVEAFEAVVSSDEPVIVRWCAESLCWPSNDGARVR